ncbi:MAG: AI-2E family transporter [Gemmatimonadetes bacterium]|nr:AI-2E family transporter [Gemmatimonadota bacterium]
MARIPALREVPFLQAAIVLIVLGAFLYDLRLVLSPFTLYLLLLVLLSPYAGTRFFVLILSAATLLFLLWLLRTTGFLLAPFILAGVLAYILNPAVEMLSRRKIGRSWAILLWALPVVAGLAVVLAAGLPALAEQIEALILQLPGALERAVAWVQTLRARILALNLPFIREEVVLQWFEELDPERISAFLQARQEEIVRRSWRAILGLGRGIGTVLTVLGYVVLTPVLSFYLLRDYDRILERLKLLMPDRQREAWLAFLAEYDLLLSRYLRGQVVAAAAVGVLTGLGLWVLGFPYPAVVGTVAGVFNLVPYLGLVASLVPAVIIALLSGSILLSLGKVALVFVLVQLLDSTVLGPRIVGGSVGLHPVWVILALAVGGSFFGFVGLLLAMPVALLLKLFVRLGLERYQSSGAYLPRSTGHG